MYQLLKLFLCVFLTSTSMFAAAGDVDSSFTSADGRVLTRVGSFGDGARKVLLQPDGKIVLIGKGTAVNSFGDFTVVRYYPDGSLDTTFDGDGKVSTTIGVQDSYSISGALQPDGKIIVVGEARGSNTSGSDFGIIRYNSDGSLDQTFGIGGKVITSFTDNSTDYATAVALQNDGKITVAGMTNGRFAVARYQTDGNLDPLFGGGKVSVAVGNRGDVAYALVIQNDGKIVAAGTANSDSPQGFLYQMGIVRLNADGSLDTSFDGDGKVLTSFGSYLTCRDIQLQEDGKILAAGGTSITSASGLDFALLRYNTDGSLDSQFGSGGKVSTPIGGNDESAGSIAIQPDGRIVLAGQTTVNSDDTNFALVRYKSDGNLDLTFGIDGKVSTAVALQDSAASVAIQPDGKIIAAGSAASLATSSVFAVVRYNPNGFIDQNFGFKVAGRTNTVVRGVIDEANAVCFQTDGKIVSAGRSRISNRYAFSLVRQNSDGTLDTTFGINGTLTTKIGVGDTDSEARAVAVQMDGKIIAAGRIYDANNTQQSLYYFALARYNTDGSLDMSFDEDGIKIITAPNEDNQAYALAVQQDGKIVVAGYADTIPGGGAAYDISVVRLNPDGSLDSTFDGDGMLTTNLGGSFNIAYSVKLQADGKIVIGGVGLRAGVNPDFALVRYNPDGSLDSGFGSNGKVFTDIGGSADEIHSIAIQNDGKIVAAGTALINSQKDFAVARYNLDGSPDASFGIAGKLVTSIESNSTDNASSVVIQNDGRIIVSGTSIVASNSNLAIVRYLSDGSLDTSFGGDGIVTTDYNIYGNTGETATASGLQADGKLIVVGSLRDRIAQGIANDRRDFLSVRFQTSVVIKSRKRVRFF